jgi:hypothetical protein
MTLEACRYPQAPPGRLCARSVATGPADARSIDPARRRNRGQLRRSGDASGFLGGFRRATLMIHPHEDGPTSMLTSTKKPHPCEDSRGGAIVA